MTYYWSYNNEEYENWNNGGNSIQECIDGARNNKEDETLVYVGVLDCHKPSIDGVEIIESLMDKASNDYGEASEWWLEGNSKVLIEKLETMLNNSLSKWLDESNQKPTFGRIVDVKCYDLGRK